MGICKCKKRSEDFCFNHKKFICDSCVVVDHSICYIKSYVDWLTDCEFEESICGVCKGRFDADDSEDSVRLGCYHLFHPECIDVYVATLSQNNSPQTYPCPKCSEPILPSNDKQSPLANTIREKFSLSSWSENYLNQFKKFNSNESPNSVMNGNHVNGYTNGHSNNNGHHHHGSTLSHTSTSNNNISPQSSEFYTNLDVLKNNSNVNSNSSIINPNLLEETPPLSHLNPNLYGVASRKHDDTIIQLGNSNNIGNIGNNIHGNNKIYDDDYDKYNKRPSSTLSKILNPIKEIPTKYLILIVIMAFVFLVLLLKMNSAQSLDDGEIDNKVGGGGGALDNGIINKDDTNNNIQNDQKQIVDQQL